MTSNTVSLPQEVAARLQHLRHTGDLKALRQYVLALRKGGWTLSVIGAPVSAPRSTVRMWELAADPNAALPDVPESPKQAKERGERTVRLYADVPREQRAELHRLADSAKQVRSRTPQTAPIRKDAEQLDAVIHTLIARTVPIKRIAQHMGVTPRAVTARHERFVARSLGEAA